MSKMPNCGERVIGHYCRYGPLTKERNSGIAYSSTMKISSRIVRRANRALFEVCAKGHRITKEIEKLEYLIQKKYEYFNLHKGPWDGE